MSAKAQYEEFLEWLKAKQREIVDEYWSANRATQREYRLLLLKLQAEISTTEILLEELHA